MTVFTATAIGLAVAALILFFTALILFFQWDIPAARRELKGQAFTDTVETLTSTLSSDGSVEAYRKMSALSLGVGGAAGESRACRRGDSRREYLRRMAADSIDFRHYPKETGVWEFTPDFILDCVNNPQNYKLAPRLRKVERKHK